MRTRSRITLNATKRAVLRAIAQGAEPDLPGYAARVARRELEQAGLVSLPPGMEFSRSWTDWGLTIDGKILMTQLGSEAAA